MAFAFRLGRIPRHRHPRRIAYILARMSVSWNAAFIHSVLFSRPRYEGWPRHGHETHFLHLFITSSMVNPVRDMMSSPSRLYVVFLAYVRLALLALPFSPLPRQFSRIFIHSLKLVCCDFSTFSAVMRVHDNVGYERSPRDHQSRLARCKLKDLSDRLCRGGNYFN